MIISDRWRESTSKVVYTPTGKEPPLYASRNEQAYWMLVGRIEGRLGPEGGTVKEIYHEVTGPLGLTSSDTVQLVKAAKKAGYLI